MKTILVTTFTLFFSNVSYSQANIAVKTGFYDSIPQAGLELGVNLSNKAQVVLDSSLGASDLDNLDGFSNYRYLDAYLALTTYNIALKYFLTKSTFLKLKTGYRSHELYNTTLLTDKGGILLTNKASSYIIGAAIGNTWSFSNGIFIGCEWFGYEQPIEQGFKETILMAAAGDELRLSTSFTQRKSELEAISKAPAISLFNLHLGISF